MANTPFMNLNLPTVSTTLGPEWASLIIAALNLIDSHDHSTDHGTDVTPAGITINADLPFGGFQATALKTSTYNSQAATLAATFLGCVYRVGSDLYYNNGAGTPIQITSGAALASPGSGVFTVGAAVTLAYLVSAADAQKVLPVDSTAIAITLTLPAATTAMHFIIKDKLGNAAVNNITIAPNGVDTIENVNASYLIDANFMSLGLISDGSSNWAVI